MQTIQIIMDLGGERYTPELAEDRAQFDLAEVARDIWSGEWPGTFVRAAYLDWDSCVMVDATQTVRELIEANERAAA